VGSRNEVDDGESESGAALSSRRVCPAEAVERLIPKIGRKAPPSVENVKRDEVAVRFCDELDPTVAVAERVVDEIAERLFDAEPVDVEVGGSGIDMQLTAETQCAAREAVGYRPQESVRIDWFSPERKRSLVGARDEEKFLREPGQTLRFLGRRAQRVGEFAVRAWPAKGEIEFRAEKREWCAELMAGVGDEAALVLDGGLKAREHVVQSGGESRDLVSRGRKRKARWFSRRDRLCAATHGLHGSKRGGGERVAAERCRNECEREEDDELVPEVVEGLSPRLERARYDRDGCS
jgi:hypothetical protein